GLLVLLGAREPPGQVEMPRGVAGVDRYRAPQVVHRARLVVQPEPAERALGARLAAVLLADRRAEGLDAPAELARHAVLVADRDDEGVVVLRELERLVEVRRCAALVPLVQV